MSADVFPDTQNQQDTDGQGPRRDVPRLGPTRDGSRGRFLKFGLLLVVLLVVLLPVGYLLSALIATADTGPRLTYTVTRGDLVVTVIEQGTVESSDNTEIKCKVRGFNTVTYVIESGTVVKPGDELVRLDTKVIEENLSLTRTNVHMARATLERTRANVAKAVIAIPAYTEGRYRSQLKGLQRGLTIATSNLRTAEKMLGRSELLFRRGYVTDLEVEGNTFTVTQAQLELRVKQTEIDVLTRFTRAMELETLNGSLTAGRSKLLADEAGLAMDKARRDRAVEELANCVVTADRSGLVIYPSAAAWKATPDITEGVTVRKDQILLLMPDLSRMQVTVGIHESIVDQVTVGLPATVTLSDRTLTARVSSVAAVTRPAGWWTGNVVKYDTIIQLPEAEGLKPGMTAEVEVVIATHKDVLSVPVAAVVEAEKGHFCWVRTAEGPRKRTLQLGDSNDVFIVVKTGLSEGDKVVLNPTAFVEEARDEALKAIDGTRPPHSTRPASTPVPTTARELDSGS